MIDELLIWEKGDRGVPGLVVVIRNFLTLPTRLLPASEYRGTLSALQGLISSSGLRRGLGITE